MLIVTLSSTLLQQSSHDCICLIHRSVPPFVLPDLMLSLYQNMLQKLWPVLLPYSWLPITLKSIFTLLTKICSKDSIPFVNNPLLEGNVNFHASPYGSPSLILSS